MTKNIHKSIDICRSLREEPACECTKRTMKKCHTRLSFECRWTLGLFLDYEGKRGLTVLHFVEYCNSSSTTTLPFVFSFDIEMF